MWLQQTTQSYNVFYYTFLINLTLKKTLPDDYITFRVIIETSLSPTNTSGTMEKHFPIKIYQFQKGNQTLMF